jgi:hypothetical protein
MCKSLLALTSPFTLAQPSRIEEMALNHLSECVAQMIDEQQGRISSMRAMIDREPDIAALGDKVLRIDAADALIHSVFTVLLKFNALDSHKKMPKADS